MLQNHLFINVLVICKECEKISESDSKYSYI